MRMQVFPAFQFQIAAIKSKYGDQFEICFDWWHVCKGLIKRLHELAKLKTCQDIKPWIDHIQRHFRFCLEYTDNPNYRWELFLSVNLYNISYYGDTMKCTFFLKTLDHVVGKHEKCLHDPLPQHRDIKYLRLDSKGYKRLCSVLREKSFENDYKACRAKFVTSELENKHSVELKVHFFQFYNSVSN